MQPAFIVITFKDRYEEFNGAEVQLYIDLNTKVVEIYDGITNTLNEDLYYKVVDTGSYQLLDENENVISTIDDAYVPDCIPNDYGDYIDLEIDNGKLSNFKANKIDILEEFEKKGV